MVLGRSPPPVQLLGWHETCNYRCARVEMSPQAPDLKTLVYCETQVIRLNQHCVKSFDLNVTDIPLYVKSRSPAIMLPYRFISNMSSIFY